MCRQLSITDIGESKTLLVCRVDNSSTWIISSLSVQENKEKNPKHSINKISIHKQHYLIVVNLFIIKN